MLRSCVHCDRAYCVVRAFPAQTHLASSDSLAFSHRAKSFDLALDHQFLVRAQIDAMLLRKALGAGADKLDVRALGQDLLRRAHRIADVLTQPTPPARSVARR